MLVRKKRKELIMKKQCGVCQKPLGLTSLKAKLIDGIVCHKCWTKAGLDTRPNVLARGTSNQYNVDTVREMLAVKAENQALIDNFVPTKKIKKVAFDDKNHYLLIQRKRNDAEIYRYDQLVSYELLEDGESVSKGGLGRAAVGGVLFGGVGAIVGSVTGGKKTKSNCTSLEVKVTIRNSPRQTLYLQFITIETPKRGIVYKSMYKAAQDTMAALQLAIESVNDKTTQENTENADKMTISAADEILKFKQLLDEGIITADEFAAKKKQLLDL